MKIFHFGDHDVARTDIINANISSSYADTFLFVDIELQCEATISLNQEDSLIFMEDFMQQVRAKSTTH
ncbi:MAG: hypothetical protein FJ211_01495 [Ignavibacteria bacterium]|nr:hypothetical protein [Ignavibacteria bacterium]